MIKPPPEKVSTKRLILRPIQGSDAEAIFAYASDSEISRYMAFARHQDLNDSYAFIDYAKEAWQKGIEYAYALIIKEDKRFIGTAGFKIEEKNAFIGYIIHKDYWHQGFTSEAMAAIVDIIKKEPFFAAITSCAHPENIASVKILENLGLQAQGDLCQSKMQFPNLPEAEQRSLQFKLDL